MTSRVLAIVLALTTLLGGCAVAESPAGDLTPAPSENRPAEAFLVERDDPRPVNLPEDAAPHDRLTEWWYYTGHLQDSEGHLYGFEFVIFQVQRGEFPPSYASHFAVTNTSSEEFHYAERSQTGGQEAGQTPINLSVGGWSLQGGAGQDHITATMDGYDINIQLETTKPPVLHEGDGFFEFAPSAASYYYSQTRMNAEGMLTIDGEELTVSGQAWMDHQWGDFLVVEDVGWDWFSIQLDNNQELMVWQSHDGEGNPIDGNATLVRDDGETVDIPFHGFDLTPTGQWTSPRTSAVYPMGWTISVEDHDIHLTVEPVLEDQELVTLESTGVVYWEGMIRITGSWEGEPVEGLGYVELTGYAKVPTR